MSAVLGANSDPTSVRALFKQGVDLLSQQIWCWGRDILREEGNWLLEIGFQRIEAPAERENCSSVYSLELPEGRRVILRGFGVFYGDDQLGGIFLKRYGFSPRYTGDATLECPPWSDSDLPKMGLPNESQRDACAALTVGLIDWINSYEAMVADRLGNEYRQQTIDSWKQDKVPVLPAEEMASAWRSLGEAFAENSQTLITRP